MFHKLKLLTKKIITGTGFENQNKTLINEEDANYMRETMNDLSMAVCRERTLQSLAPLTMSYADVNENLQAAGEILARNGIIIVTGVMDNAKISVLSEGAKRVLKESLDRAAILNESSNYEDDKIVVDRTGKHFNSYQDKAKYHKTVINVRSGADEGMIDIFNYDISFGEESGNLRNCFSSPAIYSIINTATQKEFQSENLNIYFNQDITKTRGFHVDSFSKGQIKAFLYLSDVTDLSYGPYCFVTGSHEDGKLRRLNREIAKHYGGPVTDSFFFDPRNVFPILGPRGTLVISDQGGVHRGHPQLKGRERIVAVMNYKVKT